MLRSYLPLYEIALSLGALRESAELLKGSGGYSKRVLPSDAERFTSLLAAIAQECLKHGLTHTPDLAAMVGGKTSPETYLETFSIVQSLKRRA